MKKTLVRLLTMVSCVCLLSGCGADNADKPKAESKTLAVGLMPDTDSLPFIVAQEKGYFAEEGVNVKLELYKSAMERDSALQSGNLDGSVSDLLAAAFAKAGGFDVKATSFTDGSYKLIVGKEEPAKNLAELTGKEVAVSKNTVIEFVTDEILDRENLTEHQIKKVIIPQIPTRLEMLQNGKLSAATLPEPMASVAVNGGCRHIIGSDELKINPGIMLFTDKALTEKAEEIKAFYRAYNKAVGYLNFAPKGEYLDLAITKCGFPEAAKTAFTPSQYHEATLPTKEDVEACMDWLDEKDLIDKEYAYHDIVSDLLVKDN